jgi:hypothetical protein
MLSNTMKVSLIDVLVIYLYLDLCHGLVEYELWQETKDALTMVRDYVNSHPELRPDVNAAITTSEGSSSMSSEDRNDLMYLRMFETGMEMIDDQHQRNSKKKQRS